MMLKRCCKAEAKREGEAGVMQESQGEREGSKRPGTGAGGGGEGGGGAAGGGAGAEGAGLC